MSNAQVYSYDDFNSTNSLSKWKIITNGEISFSNTYKLKGKDYITGNDKFLSIRDTSKTTMFKASISSKFKFVPCKDIDMRFKIISNDSVYDLFFYGFNITDKAQKSLLYFEYFTMCNSKYSPGISRPSFYLGEKNDSFFLKADSIEFKFRFASNGQNLLQGRQIILTEIGSTQSYLSNRNPTLKTFSVFPNPIYERIIINMDNAVSNAIISIYDLRGSIVHKTIGCSGSNFIISLEDLKSGYYVIEVRDFENIYRNRILKID